MRVVIAPDRFKSGLIDLLHDLVRFPAALTGAGQVITGEGSLDRQSLAGKAPGAPSAARAAAAGAGGTAPRGDITGIRHRC